jgi:hypothetical protein
MRAVLIFLTTFAALASPNLAADKGLPKGFKLSYEHDAGMVPLREKLVIYSGKGSYTAFEKGKNYTVKLGKKHQDRVLELYNDLKRLGVFQLKIKNNAPQKPRPPIADGGYKNLILSYKGFYLSLSEQGISKISKKDQQTVRAAFKLLANFTQHYRQ